MISQKKVRLMAISAIYKKHGGELNLFAAKIPRNRYCAVKSIETGILTAAALIFMKILQNLISGQWDAVNEQIRSVGIRTFFTSFHPVFDVFLIVVYMLFAFYWYGKRYETVSEEAKKELNRRELIRKLDDTRRIG
ncbi:MAG: hypothetical protein ACOX78_00260 [Lachnospiraceae bacterium]|jgi:hypothetical protein